MLRAGDVYLVDVPGDKTDHFWLMVSDIGPDGTIIYAMLTDARNLDFQQHVFRAGTSAWGDFSLKKDTAVDAARAGCRSAAAVADALSVAGIFQSSALPEFLDAVKVALRQASETPPAVKEAL
jgi:hypothetical protein